VPLYFIKIVKVGEATPLSMPKKREKPRVNAVFPAPRSPMRQITLGEDIFDAREYAKFSVSSTLFVIVFKNTSFL
jgi:hypothetical protein